MRKHQPGPEGAEGEYIWFGRIVKIKSALGAVRFAASCRAGSFRAELSARKSLFGYALAMVTPSTSITPLILEKLAEGEKRSLTLVVSIRRSLGRSAFLKGDLSAVVNSALRKLIATKKVIEVDGVYSLAPVEAAAD